MGRVRVRSDGGELPDDSPDRLARMTSPSRFIDETEMIDETCGQRPFSATGCPSSWPSSVRQQPGAATAADLDAITVSVTRVRV